MVKRVHFSNAHLEFYDIVTHHLDTTFSLKRYFMYTDTRCDRRFLGYTADEMAIELSARIDELSHTPSLSLLAALEAAFRIDYLQRNAKKKKHPPHHNIRPIRRHP